MNLLEAMHARHSVRQYLDKPLAPDAVDALNDEIAVCNKEGGLHIQLIVNEPKAFDGTMAHYGKFSGVTNYIALVRKKTPDIHEKCGYYGERIVLKAQQLGLNTCWVAMTYSKIPEVFQIKNGEKLTVVIAVGYGKTQGIAHKSKAPGQVSNVDGSSPEWFKKGVEAALLAPTAMNQQKFYLKNENGRITAQAKMGFYSKMDLGIVKYHFELAAGKTNFEWA